MSPHPQFSLCIPVSSNSEHIQEFSDNISQFFQRFPLLYEVLFAVNPHQDQGLSLLQYLSDRNPHYHVYENEKPLSRSENFVKLFNMARGDVLVAIDINLALPLSEIFKVLEVFFSQPETQVVFGVRGKTKKHLESGPPEIPTFSDKIEAFFNDVIHDKTSWPFADPFCPFLALRKNSFAQIQNELRKSGWYWTHEVQRAVRVKTLPYEEIPLYFGSRRIPKPQGLKALVEALRLLKFILFRI